MTIESTIRQFAKDRAAAPAQAQHKFPIKPYLSLARKVFEDAQGSNDMGVIADLLETQSRTKQVEAEHFKALERCAYLEGELKRAQQAI